MVFFWKYFGWFLGSDGVPWGHGLVTQLRGLKIERADAEMLVCARILRMYDWVLIT